MLFFRGISLLGLALGLGLHKEVNYTIVNRKVRNAMKKCNYFMEEAFECDPAKQKINKYKHRLHRVLSDSVHHLKKGKCNVNKKNIIQYDFLNQTENEEFERLDSEFENFKDFEVFNRKSKIRIENLELFCNKNFMKFFEQKSLENCQKLGAWRKRSAHLLDDLRKLVIFSPNQNSAWNFGSFGVIF